MMARIGAILAPYIVLLVRKLPLIRYGACIVARITTLQFASVDILHTSNKTFLEILLQ